MGVQAIDQKKFPSVLGKTKVFYRPRSLTSSNRTLWSFPIPRGKYVDLLPALPLNNCILSHGKTPLNINQTFYQVKK
jgi:hypothetical protein